MSKNLQRPKSFGVTVPMEVREVLEEYAKIQDRSLSYIAARILTENISTSVAMEKVSAEFVPQRRWVDVADMVHRRRGLHRPQDD